MSEEITRKDGITYTRKSKSVNYNKNIIVRVKNEDLIVFKEIAEINQTTMSDILRDFIEKTVEDYIRFTEVK